MSAITVILNNVVPEKRITLTFVASFSTFFCIFKRFTDTTGPLKEKTNTGCSPIHESGNTDSSQGKKSIFAKFYGTQCSVREAAADMNANLCVAAEWGFLPQSLRENIIFRKKILQTCFVFET